MSDRASVQFGDAVIAAAGTLSGAVNVDGALAVNIDIPTCDDAAVITFSQSSHEAGTYYNIYDELGVEVSIPSGTHNKNYATPYLVGHRWIKIRSGTAGATTAQTSAVTLVVKGTR